MRKEEREEARTRAGEDEAKDRARDVAYFRRFAAARRSLIRDGERYPMPEQIRARAELLSEAEVEAILAERRAAEGRRR